MSDTDQKREDDVLRRMLATPPTPHKPLKPKTAPRDPFGVKRIVGKKRLPKIK